MEFFTYAIFNKYKDKFYIGHTNNISNRLERHNGTLPSKNKSYTKRNKGKWELIYSEKFMSRKEAMGREKQLKSYQGRQFIKKFII